MGRSERIAGLCLAACIVASAAHAGFVNGGFEEGTFNGWTRNGGLWSGGIGTYTYTGDPGQSAIVTPGSDPILLALGVDMPTVYSGSYSARANNHTDGGGCHFSTISQTAAWTDPHIFFAWSAVLQDAGHAHDAEPHFSITLHDDTTGADLYNIVIAADTAPPGTFQNAGGWLYSGWQIVDLDVEALGAVGDTLTLTLLASDCSLGADAGAVYLDGFGAEAPAQNEPPVANAGPDQTVPRNTPTGASVTLDGSGSSDPEEAPLTYAWTWAGGSASGVSPTITLPQGQTTITLVVNDGELDSAPDTVVITVTNTAPVANAGPDQTLPRNTPTSASVTLDGSGSSDANGDTLTYSWTWAGGSASGVSPTITLPQGATTITLVVNDGELDSAPDTVVITVTNTAPVANAGPDRTVEKNCAAGAMVTLDGSGSSDANTDPLTYAWTWADGTAAGVGPTILLPLGETAITLVVNDGELDSQPDTVAITVVRPAPRPLKRLVASYLTERLNAIGATDRWTSNLLTEAIKHVQNSLEPRLWQDDAHVTADGKRVFNEEQEAVRCLNRILANPSADPEVLADVRAAVDDLVAADEAIVLTDMALAMALVRPKGGKSPLDKAGRLYDRAMTEWQAGECCAAIGSFCQAWQEILKATKGQIK